MAKKDFAQLALSVVEKATRGDKARTTQKGRAGGFKGGKARAKALTGAQRSEIARVAASARWKKKRH
ncbi:MAG: hypothetical protein DME60_09425 [Verrucomicrobia bacterium]|nr:MAG: hypothetical protein DME60_09425 [Verrucomicrobiota bacterium]